MTLLQARNLHVRYDTTEVLSDLSIDLLAGEVVALLGPNGSGKSTLIRTLLGHLRASGGEILWEDRPLARLSPRALARRVAYLAQTPAYDPESRVEHVVRMGRSPYLSMFGLETTEDRDVVEAILNETGLTAFRHRAMDELSGGQRQRVFIARALAQQPVAMLLDEPGTHLDLHHHVEMYRQLRTLAQQKLIGVLIAAHDITLAAQFADRIVLLSDGRVVANGTPTDVLQADALSKVYGLQLARLSDVEPGRVVIVPVL